MASIHSLRSEPKTTPLQALAQQLDALSWDELLEARSIIEALKVVFFYIQHTVPFTELASGQFQRLWLSNLLLHNRRAESSYQ